MWFDYNSYCRSIIPNSFGNVFDQHPPIPMSQQRLFAQEVIDAVDTVKGNPFPSLARLGAIIVLAETYRTSNTGRIFRHDDEMANERKFIMSVFQFVQPVFGAPEPSPHMRLFQPQPNQRDIVINQRPQIKFHARDYTHGTHSCVGIGSGTCTLYGRRQPDVCARSNAEPGRHKRDAGAKYIQLAGNVKKRASQWLTATSNALSIYIQEACRSLGFKGA